MVQGLTSPFLFALSVTFPSELPNRTFSPSLNATALTGATVGTIAEDEAFLTIGLRGGLVADFEVKGADESEAFDDLIACDCISDEFPMNEDTDGD
ncbi:hypothetical protein PX690_21315 [Bacillus velezensis]|uniref:hypothetical protein n=1 Tax=Bacillus velezensis TaxID=492670 RepID=UPI0023E15F34|nr:hypothetical protein [Bacillus velezensis]WES02016.1 hypothetical protein PX690_21315 [Bacillus velezensis]